MLKYVIFCVCERHPFHFICGAVTNTMVLEMQPLVLQDYTIGRRDLIEHQLRRCFKSRHWTKEVWRGSSRHLFPWVWRSVKNVFLDKHMSWSISEWTPALCFLIETDEWVFVLLCKTKCWVNISKNKHKLNICTGK